MISPEQKFPYATFDWLWFLAILALSGAGTLAIWSTTSDTGLSIYFSRQLIYLCCGLLCFLALLYFDYHVFSDFIVMIYCGGMFALLLVLILGRSVSGNKSWLNLGFSFQPSEFVKIIVIIALAKYYAEIDSDFLNLRELLTGAAIVFVPTILVLLQGDLGTAITFVPIYAALSFLAGVRKKHWIALLLIGIMAAPCSWFLMKGYHKDRIETILNPEKDPQRIGYQTIQSQIAIGSGKFLGKGFKQGSQGLLGFLPARHTDFVFAVLAEEKGFVGGITILGLFLFVFFRLFRVGREAKDKVGAMIASGVMSIILFHAVINIGMAVGWVPVIGIPLPFISAGGSSLISCFIGMGLCMNIWMRRYVN